ncbi:MAG TPA: hypothetical protein VF406_21585 [Thermodesulfobacteriota bacterium]
MRRVVRRMKRLFNWDVVIRLALVPAVGYVLAGAALGASRKAAREAAMAAVDAAAFLGR